MMGASVGREVHVAGWNGMCACQLQLHVPGAGKHCHAERYQVGWYIFVAQQCLPSALLGTIFTARSALLRMHGTTGCYSVEMSFLARMHHMWQVQDGLAAVSGAWERSCCMRHARGSIAHAAVCCLAGQG